MASRYTSRLTTCTFLDNGAQTITCGPGPGNATIGEFRENNTEAIKVTDRGQHDGFVRGDDLVQDFAIEIQMKNEVQTHATLGRINDWLRRAGSFAVGAANATTSVDSTIWCFKVRLTFNDGTTSSTLTLPNVEAGYTFAEAKEGHKISIKGRNHVAPVWA